MKVYYSQTKQTLMKPETYPCMILLFPFPYNYCVFVTVTSQIVTVGPGLVHNMTLELT